MNRFRIALAALFVVAVSGAAVAANVDDRNPIINNGKGFVVGNPTGGELGPGMINSKGVYVDGVPVGGGLSVPSSCVLAGTGTALAPVTLGGGLTCPGGVLTAPTGGSGTVTSAGVATANGFSGTVANPTTTPTITITVPVTGLLKGNGTGVSAAAAGTDFIAPTGSGASLTGLTFGQIGGAVAPAALPIATTGALGAFKPDGSTITVNSSTGVASAVGGAATSVVVGATTVGGGTSGQFLYNNAGAIGSAPTTGTGTTAVLNVSPSIATPTITGLATLNGGLTDSSATGIATTGPLTVGGGPTTQLGGVINNVVTYAFPTTGFIRNRYFLDTVTANTNSSQIDEGYFLQRQYGGTATLTGEINGFHAAFTDVAGITLNNSMENFEASDFYVTAHNGVTSYLALHNFGATGSATVVNGFIAGLTNANTTTNSIVSWGAFNCQGMGGGGSLPQHNYCVNNQDPLQLIMTKGHLQFFAQFQPTLSGCGTSPSLDGYSSNSQGVVTEGTGATGCTITWATFDPWSIGLNPHCDVTSPNGSAFISYTPTTATMTIVNLTGSPSPARYKWSCFQ
jgi:hypothetical protein